MLPTICIQVKAKLGLVLLIRPQKNTVAGPSDGSQL